MNKKRYYVQGRCIITEWPHTAPRVKVQFQGQLRHGKIHAQSSYGKTYVTLDYDEKEYRVFPTMAVRLEDGRQAPRRKK